MSKIDSTETIDARRRGRDRRHRARRRRPLAVSRRACCIGQVVDVRRDANAVVQTAYLQPAADLDRLEYVLVITDYEGGLPPIDEQPIDCSDRARGGDPARGRAAVPRRRPTVGPHRRHPAP